LQGFGGRIRRGIYKLKHKLGRADVDSALIGFGHLYSEARTTEYNVAKLRVFCTLIIKNTILRTLKSDYQSQMAKFSVLTVMIKYIMDI
jgi:hypothetical protein